MTTLGEAFISVKADLKPFTQNLKAETEAVINSMEKNVEKGLGDTLKKTSAKAGKEAGDKIGEEIERGVKKRFSGKDKSTNWFTFLASSLASALDDGISALPAEAKAAIVAGIFAALPIVSGALAGAVTAGLGAGLAGLGFVLAFQFDEVKAKGTETFAILRGLLLHAAEPFAKTTMEALDQITDQFIKWTPMLSRIFANASQYVEPLTSGILDFLGGILSAIDRIGDKMTPFVNALGDGLEVLGIALGDFLETLANTGDDGVQAFQDLIFIVVQLINYLGSLISTFAKVYGWVRQIALAVPFLSSALGAFFASSEAAGHSAKRYRGELDDLDPSIDATVAATKKQQKAIDDAAKAMDKARDAAFNLIDANIAYEEAIDRLDATLEENGKTLDTTGEKGRENMRALGTAIKAAQDQAEQQFQQGKLNSEQTQAFYQNEINKIIQVGKAHGLTEEAIRREYGAAIDLINIPNQDTGWLNTLLSKAQNLAAALERAGRAAGALAGTPAAGQDRFSRFFAEGGIVNRPTSAVIGESGPEVVIPLTNPTRAAQLAQQSGLSNMLGGGGNTDVYVYIGNEHLDSRMVRIVERNNNRQAQALAYGSR